MAPGKKRQYATATDKQRAFAERQQEAGKRRVCFWLSEETIEKLARLATANGTDRGGVIDTLASKAREPKSLNKR